jgi:menaquinone-dependent protoporphyrinogen IX oxidase
MRVVIVYESMFGNTRLIADAVAEGLAPGNEVTVVPVAEAGRGLLDRADLVVAGGPTHVHGMSRARARRRAGVVRTRASAVEMARKEDSHLTLDASAEGPGLRDWLAGLGQIHARGAAFDTRVDGSPVLTGRASKTIAKLLERHGIALLAPAESFLVTKDNQLRPGERDRAGQWGRQLAAMLPAAGPVR